MVLTQTCVNRVFSPKTLEEAVEKCVELRVDLAQRFHFFDLIASLLPTSMPVLSFMPRSLKKRSMAMRVPEPGSRTRKVSSQPNSAHSHPTDQDPGVFGARHAQVRRQGRGQPERDIDYADSYPLRDTTVLYYWRATYWRRLTS